MTLPAVPPTHPAVKNSGVNFQVYFREKWIKAYTAQMKICSKCEDNSSNSLVPSLASSLVLLHYVDQSLQYSQDADMSPSALLAA